MNFSSWRKLVLLSLLLGLVVALLAGAGWLWWRQRSSSLPELARLLPDGQVLFYANLQPLRQAGLLDDAKNDARIKHSAGYAAFIQASGFDFERDVDAVALSMQGVPPAPHQSMLLLQGRFRPQFFRYLQQQGGAPALLEGHRLYRADGPDGPLQILVLDQHRIAVTNASDRAVLRAQLDRAPHWWQPWRSPSGPALLQSLRANQPTGALAWMALDYAGLASQQQTSGWLSLLEGSRTLLLRVDADPIRGAGLTLVDSTVLASDAHRIDQKLEQLTDLYTAHAAGDPNADPRMRQLLQHLRFDQDGASLRITLMIPPAELKALFALPTNKGGDATNRNAGPSGNAGQSPD